MNCDNLFPIHFICKTANYKVHDKIKYSKFALNEIELPYSVTSWLTILMEILIWKQIIFKEKVPSIDTECP